MLDVVFNIKNGFCYKIFVEGVKKFDLGFIDGVFFDLVCGVMGIVGFDVCYY